MKNIDILNLVNGGILGVTANDLGAEHAYKVYKFKKAVAKVYDAIHDSEKALREETGIKDGVAFDKERKELHESGSNAERLVELDKTFTRFAELRSKLYNETADLGDIKTIPFSAFHDLQRENKELDHKPLNFFEELLEGVLWKEEEE